MKYIINHYVGLCLLLFTFSALFLSVFSTSTSMLFPAPSVDSHTFQMMGLSILHGKIPYIELFDHKGPLLYFIEALGLSIDLSWGILLIQSIALTVTSWLWYQTLSLFMQKQWQIITCIFIGYFMLIAYESGNMTEDWSLPFISYVICVCLKAILCNACRVPFTQLIGIGICFSAVAFIRVNNIFPCLGFVIYILFCNIKNKRYLYILKAFSLCLWGLIVPALCIVAWFYSIGGLDAVKEMFFGTISFNLAYMAKTSACDSLFAMKSLAPLVFFVLLILIRLKSHKGIVVPTFMSYLLGMTVIGGAYFRHYFIVFIPLILLSVAVTLNEKWKYSFLISILAVCFITAASPLLRLTQFYSTQRWKDFQLRATQFAEMIQQNSIDGNPIWLYDAPEALDLLIANNQVPCNRFILSHLPNFSDHLERETGILNQRKPELILKMSTNVISNSHDLETLENDYNLVGSTHISLCEKNVSLYRRKHK